MAYPASTQVLADGLREANNVALTVKSQAQKARTDMAAGPVLSGVVLSLLNLFNVSIQQLNSVAAIGGIGAYAQAQFDDTELDIAAEFNAMLAAMADTRDWIVANFPKDGDGYLLNQQFDGTAIVVRSFTSEQTAGLRAELDALIATID